MIETKRLLLTLQQFFKTKAPACQQSECPRSHSMQFLLSTRACIRIQTKKTSPLQSLLCQSQPPARPTYEHSRLCTSSFATCAERGCPKKLVCADVHDTSIPPDSPRSCRRSPPHCVKESFSHANGQTGEVGWSTENRHRECMRPVRLRDGGKKR